MYSIEMIEVINLIIIPKTQFLLYRRFRNSISKEGEKIRRRNISTLQFLPSFNNFIP